MSEKIRFFVGNDPHGYGGDEVSQEQADAYAAAIVAELGQKFPGADLSIGIPDGFFPQGEQLKLAGWVQSNWRRIRQEVNTARGWEEQFGGQKW